VEKQELYGWCTDLVGNSVIPCSSLSRRSYCADLHLLSASTPVGSKESRIAGKSHVIMNSDNQ